MQVFFVSIRTALIYGPSELLEARPTGADQLYLRVSWPHAYGFDDWEGYAVVVPERDEVWGMIHPRLGEGELEAEFTFAPQPIPPKDRKLFVAQEAKAGEPKANPQKPSKASKSSPKASSKESPQPAAGSEPAEAEEEAWNFYQEDENP
ncbi:MAG: hypothetical protein ACAI44_40705 [Candidatus Sericytochromatia bacterium]